MVATAQDVGPIWSDSSATRRKETMCCHAQETYEKNLKAVQELEGCLGITWCWVLEDGEWQAAARLIFKLSKMNQSGTRYKLCKHIRKALQTCSAAIWGALTQYNTTAKALGCQTLQFDEVVDGMLALGISMSHGLGDSTGVPQHVHMEATLSSLPVDADNGEEDANDNADKDQTATLEEECEALQNILSVTVDT
ncbi:hypothetical protein EDD17DRAFT_1761652 [Pisolithus thermaeus]|nr:hypothetical protein EDD17DRAFT_1761652 [Pisolithus thermaeus]